MNWHARIVKLGLDTNPVVATRLLNAYAVDSSPSSLACAYHLFDQVPHKDTTLWTSIISLYNKAGHSHTSLQLFSQMLHQTRPNQFVYATVARACASSITHLQLGKTIHSLVIKTGFLSNVVVATSLLDMYGKCRLVDFARNMFDEMPHRNVISWNAMIAAFMFNGVELDALELFYEMKCREFLAPDEFAYATVLTACAGLQDLKLGMQVHADLLIVGFEMGCARAICNMYMRCGEVPFAERVFTEVRYNSLMKLMMIKGYVFNGRHCDALKLMARESNFIEIVKADPGVVVSVLTACADLILLRIGRQVHGLIVTLFGGHLNCEPEDDASVIISALLDMYCKCSMVGEARRIFNNLLPRPHVSHWNTMVTGYIYNGLLEDAKDCFEEMPERNVVSWTTMITGYVQHGLPHEGLRLLVQMYSNKGEVIVQGNCLTFTIALEACSLLTMLEVGKQIHANLIRSTANADISNVVVGTALIDMYSKCGNLNYSERVFCRMTVRNVVSWTSMITGYAIHGLSSQALEVFKEMMTVGVRPNEVTFVSILTCCSHCGLVEEGMRYFKLMTDKYGIVPRSDHYACVVDLLGRAGRLPEALSLVEKIEDEAVSGELHGGAIWGALLGACKLYGNVMMGREAAEKMLEKEQQVSETYIAISNIYAAAGMWDEAYRLREKWKRKVCGIGEAGRSRIHM